MVDTIKGMIQNPLGLAASVGIGLAAAASGPIGLGALAVFGFGTAALQSAKAVGSVMNAVNTGDYTSLNENAARELGMATFGLASAIGGVKAFKGQFQGIQSVEQAALTSGKPLNQMNLFDDLNFTMQTTGKGLVNLVHHGVKGKGAAYQGLLTTNKPSLSFVADAAAKEVATNSRLAGFISGSRTVRLKTDSNRLNTMNQEAARVHGGGNGVTYASQLGENSSTLTTNIQRNGTATTASRTVDIDGPITSTESTRQTGGFFGLNKKTETFTTDQMTNFQKQLGSQALGQNDLALVNQYAEYAKSIGGKVVVGLDNNNNLATVSIQGGNQGVFPIGMWDKLDNLATTANNTAKKQPQAPAPTTALAQGDTSTVPVQSAVDDAPIVNPEDGKLTAAGTTAKPFNLFDRETWPIFRKQPPREVAAGTLVDDASEALARDADLQTSFAQARTKYGKLKNIGMGSTDELNAMMPDEVIAALQGTDEQASLIRFCHQQVDDLTKLITKKASERKALQGKLPKRKPEFMYSAEEKQLAAQVDRLTGELTGLLTKRESVLRQGDSLVQEVSGMQSAVLENNTAATQLNTIRTRLEGRYNRLHADRKTAIDTHYNQYVAQQHTNAQQLVGGYGHTLSPADWAKKAGGIDLTPTDQSILTLLKQLEIVTDPLAVGFTQADVVRLQASLRTSTDFGKAWPILRRGFTATEQPLTALKVLVTNNEIPATITIPVPRKAPVLYSDIRSADFANRSTQAQLAYINTL